MKLALLLFTFWFAGMASVGRAAEVVWSGLVYATVAKQPAPIPKQLTGFGHKLESVFGYNNLELVSEHREVMDDRNEHWLLPGKNFCLKVDSHKAPDRGYLLDLQLFEEKKPLVKTQTKLGKQSPLFLRGPMYADGQLIIVILVE
jgi:hypothetical protein